MRRGINFFQAGASLTENELKVEQFIRSMPRREQTPARVYLVQLDPEFRKMIQAEGEQPTPNEIAFCRLLCLKKLANAPFWKGFVNDFYTAKQALNEAETGFIARASI